jgi:hypothetical protein
MTVGYRCAGGRISDRALIKHHNEAAKPADYRSASGFFLSGRSGRPFRQGTAETRRSDRSICTSATLRTDDYTIWSPRWPQTDPLDAGVVAATV